MSMPKSEPHFKNQKVRRMSQVVVRYILARARYAARRVMMGGNKACAFHCEGCVVTKERKSCETAVSAARE